MSEVEFDSHGARCAGTWVEATSDELAGPAGRPVVVMAHGFGCTRDCGLMPFAERFAATGLEVLLFDYRGFGTSGGAPRQLVSHRRQRQDYHAAITFARARAGVDPDRVVLWGTSYSGGHVVAVAAQDPRVAAVISQGAAVDGLAILRKPERADPDAPADRGRRMVVAALRDAARTVVRRSPVLVDSVGPPGAFAMLTDAASWAHYEAMMGPTWERRVCARSLLRLPFNRPVTLAPRVRCPTLFVVVEADAITPPGAVRATAARMPRADVVAFAGPHFEIYRDPLRAQSLTAQVDFLRRVLA